MRLTSTLLHNPFKGFILWLLYLLHQIDITRSTCFPHQVLLPDVHSSNIGSGPTKTLTVLNNTLLTSNEWMSSFFVKFDQANAGTIPAATTSFIPIVRAESTNGAVTVFWELQLLKTGATTFKLRLNTDGATAPLNLVNDDNVNADTGNWWYFNIQARSGTGGLNYNIYTRTSQNRASNQEIVANTAHNIPTRTIQLTQKINIAGTDYFFPGQIAKFDIIEAAYDNSGNQPFLNWIFGIPKTEYIIDFTDPQVTQLFKNRANTTYPSAFNGETDHSDIHDLFYNKVNKWSQRRFPQYIKLPKFADQPYKRHEVTFQQRYRAWAVNTWQRQRGRYYQFSRYTSGDGIIYSFMIQKENYANNLRLYWISGGGWRTFCWDGFSATNHDSYSTRLYATVHYSDTYTYHTRHQVSFGCGGVMGGVRNYNGKRGLAADDYFLIGRKYLPADTFPAKPFNQYNNDSDNNENMQMEINYELFQLSYGGVTLNTNGDYHNPCSTNTLEEVGLDATALKSQCDLTPDLYYPYHEVNQCIKKPLDPNFKDCDHDMDSVGSKCYRCQRFTGKTGVQGCFTCYEGCLECTGPGKDQCVYCAQGYGFTGTSCNKCTTDQCWDQYTNLCQLKKERNVEIDYGLETFGKVKLNFMPLNGDADLSLYVENLFKKFWMIEINRQYKLTRSYTNVPLHRKVSISFEFLIVDTNSYDHFYVAMDNIYFFQYSPNQQDKSQAFSNYRGYGYWDLEPQRHAFTMYHSANTMELGLIGFWNTDYLNVWIRELNVTFFGCYSACSLCTVDNSPVHCTACLPGYYLVGSECKACLSSCKTCSGSASSCTSCPGGNLLKGVSCVVTCGLGFYSDTAGVCQPCPSSCVQCASLTQCFSCQPRFFLNGLTCSACNAACDQCAGTATTCLTCPTGQLLKTDTSTCVANPAGCPTGGGGYYVKDSSYCQLCSTGCTNCLANGSCATCDSANGYYKKQTGCSKPCGDGWYLVGPANTDCAQCDSKCSKCLTSPTNCQQCQDGYYLSGSTCTPCTTPCQGCSGSATSCTSCISGKFLSGTSCVDSSACAAGTYAFNSVCQPCNTLNCATCVSSATTCTSCNLGRFLSGSSCVTNCGSGFKQLGSICCPDQCSACSSSTNCSACETGYFLQGTSCIACSSNCLTCATSSTSCQSCHGTNLLQNGICVPTCSVGYYQSGVSCLQCSSTCKTCSGPSATQCLTCIDKHILYKSICQNCDDPLSQYFEYQAGKCSDKCGTGNRFTSTTLNGLGSYNSCDDGNLINGDGCSANCGVERSFRCEGGSPDDKDVCYSTIKPEATIKKIFDDKFKISFSKEIELRDVENKKYTGEQVLVINIPEAQDNQYTYTVVAPQGPKIDHLNVTLDYKTSIEDGTLEVRFKRANMLEPVNNNQLKNLKISAKFSYVIYPRYWSEPINNITASASQVSMQIAPIMSLGVTNYIMQNYIRFLMTVQTLSFFSFFNVEVSPQIHFLLGGAMDNTAKTLPSLGQYLGEQINKTRTVLSDEQLATTAAQALRNLQTATTTTATNTSTKSSSGNTNSTEAGASTSIQDTFDSKSSPKRFKEKGFMTSMVANLSFAQVMVFIGAIWYYLANMFLMGRVTPRSKWIWRFLAYNSERCFYIAMLFTMIEYAVFGTLNVVHPDFSSIQGILSFMAAFFAIIIMLLLPVFIYKVSNHYVTTLWHPEYYQRFGFFYCEFRLNTKWSKCFLSLLVSRMVFFGIALAALHDIPLAQTGLTFIINLSYFICLCSIKPFVSRIMLWVTATAEFFLVVSNMLFVINAIGDLNGSIQGTQRETVDYVNCTCIFLCLFFTFVGIFFMIILKIIQFVKSYKANKKIKEFNARLKEQNAEDEEEQRKKQEEEEEANKEEEFDLEGFEEDFMKEKDDMNEFEFEQDFLNDAPVGENAYNPKDEDFE